jgi:hypothetical protein
MKDGVFLVFTDYNEISVGGDSRAELRERGVSCYESV